MRPPRPRIPTRLAGPLDPLVTTGVLDSSDVAVTRALTGPETPDPVVQAVAMVSVVRRLGHTCLTLADADERLASAAAVAARDRGASEHRPVPAPVFPAPDDWIATLQASDLVEVAGPGGLRLDRPLVLDPDAGLVWFARYAFYEQDLARRLLARAAGTDPSVSEPAVRAALEAARGADGDPDRSGLSGEQHDAIVTALTRPLTFLVGGPGTGKTWTLGWLVAAARRLGIADEDIALAAPTGKAAERMTSALGRGGKGRAGLTATTIHQLLGIRPGTTSAPGEHTVPRRLVIIDEASMIDLPTMARLVGAMKPDTRLVFVGDPDQLASVDVGSVLADVVAAAADPSAPLHGAIARLTKVFRQSEDSAIIELATAIRAIDRNPERADAGLDRVERLLGIAPEGSSGPAPEPAEGLGFVQRDRTGTSEAEAALFATVADASRAMIAAAEDASRDPSQIPACFRAASACKVLAATRRGPGSVDEWSRRLRDTLGFREHAWQVGRPILITRNDRANGLTNGDVGITLGADGSPDTSRVAFPDREPMTPSALADFEDWWAMTIHKSQGSEYGHVVVSLPSSGSPLLTRELIYTAVTRASRRVTIVGDPQVLRAALRRPSERASGLAGRLRGA